MKREVLQSNVTDVSFVKGHGKQRAGIYYNIAKKADMTNNHRTTEARSEIRNAWKTTRSPQEHKKYR